MNSSNDGSGRSMQYANKCIVGEAHSIMFGSEHYNSSQCHPCSALSDKFGSILAGEFDSNHISRKQLLIKNIKLFTEHWKTEHNPLIGQKVETEQPEVLLDAEPIRVKSR